MIGVDDKSANFSVLTLRSRYFLITFCQLNWTSSCTLIFYLLAEQVLKIFFCKSQHRQFFFLPHLYLRRCLCWERLFNLFLFHWKPNSKNVSDTHTTSWILCPKSFLCPYLDAKVTRDNKKSFERFNHGFWEHFSNFFYGQRKGQQRNLSYDEGWPSDRFRLALQCLSFDLMWNKVTGWYFYDFKRNELLTRQ